MGLFDIIAGAISPPPQASLTANPTQQASPDSPSDIFGVTDKK